MMCLEPPAYGCREQSILDLQCAPKSGDRRQRSCRVGWHAASRAVDLMHHQRRTDARMDASLRTTRAPQYERYGVLDQTLLMKRQQCSTPCLFLDAARRKKLLPVCDRAVQQFQAQFVNINGTMEKVCVKKEFAYGPS